MDDALTPEEYEEGEETAETSGVLVLDGESWRNRGSRTYHSLLDINGVTDLFSEESTGRYHEKQQEGSDGKQGRACKELLY